MFPRKHRRAVLPQTTQAVVELRPSRDEWTNSTIRALGADWAAHVSTHDLLEVYLDALVGRGREVAR